MKPPSLTDAAVHVWTASLLIGRAALGDLCALLADDERARAERFRFALHRRRFIAARACLRTLLSQYVGTDPAAIRFGYASRGKPFLADHPELRFNLAHAEDVAVVAVALRREVGVDIEAMAPRVDTDAVARHSFSSLECESLAKLPPGTRREAFFAIWTRKEAYVKALGEGLGYPTRSFSVSLRPDDDDALLADGNEAGARGRWRLSALSAPEGFRAALAAPGRDWSPQQLTAPLMSC